MKYLKLFEGYIDEINSLLTTRSKELGLRSVYIGDGAFMRMQSGIVSHKLIGYESELKGEYFDKIIVIKEK